MKLLLVVCTLTFSAQVFASKNFGAVYCNYEKDHGSWAEYEEAGFYPIEDLAANVSRPGTGLTYGSETVGACSQLTGLTADDQITVDFISWQNSDGFNSPLTDCRTWGGSTGQILQNKKIILSYGEYALDPFTVQKKSYAQALYIPTQEQRKILEGNDEPAWKLTINICGEIGEEL